MADPSLPGVFGPAMERKPFLARQATIVPTAYIEPVRVTRWLAVIIAFLVAADFAGAVSKFVFGHDEVYGLVPLFNMDGEGNIPTFFSALLHAASACLFYAAWKASRAAGSPQPVWALMAVVFCYTAVDEASVIHEIFIEFTRSALATSGIFYFAWVIPYGMATLALSVFAASAFWRLRPDIRTWFILSALTFLSGAIGLEMVDGAYFEVHSFDFTYAILTMLEETLEMGGLAMLVFALLRLIELEYGRFSLAVGTAAESERVL